MLYFGPILDIAGLIRITVDIWLHALCTLLQLCVSHQLAVSVRVHHCLFFHKEAVLRLFLKNLGRLLLVHNLVVGNNWSDLLDKVFDCVVLANQILVAKSLLDYLDFHNSATHLGRRFPISFCLHVKHNWFAHLLLLTVEHLINYFFLFLFRPN